MRELKFSNGDIMPNLGLGTWKSQPGEVYTAVKEAVRIGYRHIDCAFVYANESEIGKALTELFADNEIRREELWITSKLWNNMHARDAVQPALKNTLKDLRLEYLDLYLIHWPVLFRADVGWPSGGSEFLPLEKIPLQETWQAMIKCRDAGLSRHIGVSNFSIAKIRGLIETTGVRPEVNQVELQPLLQQNALKEYCDGGNIYLTAYSPLGSRDRSPGFKAVDEPDLFDDPVIKAIALRHGCTPAQVLVRWAIQRGTSVIPKSVNAKRMKLNYEAQFIELSDGDMAEIASLDRHFRFINGKVFEMEGSPYTAAGLWDE